MKSQFSKEQLGYRLETPTLLTSAHFIAESSTRYSRAVIIWIFADS